MRPPVADPVTCWVVDPVTSRAEFSVSEFGRRLLAGRFRSVSGSVSLGGGGLPTLDFDLRADVGSIDTGNAMRDLYLCSSELLEASRDPVARFRGLRTAPSGRHRLLVEGELSWHAVIRPLLLDVIWTEPSRFRAFAVIRGDDFAAAYEGTLRHALRGRIASVVLDAELVDRAA